MTFYIIERNPKIRRENKKSTTLLYNFSSYTHELLLKYFIFVISVFV